MKVAKKKADGFRYDSDMHRMYINKTQYFGPLSRQMSTIPHRRLPGLRKVVEGS